MLWILLLIVLVVFLMLNQQSGFFNDFQTNTQKQTQALNVLNERYARGEIDTDEYSKMKKNLTI